MGEHIAKTMDEPNQINAYCPCGWHRVVPRYPASHARDARRIAENLAVAHAARANSEERMS